MTDKPPLLYNGFEPKNPRKGLPNVKAPDRCSYREPFSSTQTEVNRTCETCNSDKKHDNIILSHTITPRQQNEKQTTAGALPGELPDHFQRFNYSITGTSPSILII